MIFCKHEKFIIFKQKVGTMDFDSIKKRKTIRKFKDVPIEREDILNLIEAAIEAPSAHNFQPWEFILIDSKDLKEKLSKKMATTWQTNLKRDGKPSSEIKKRIVLSKERINNAPFIVIPCFNKNKVETYGDERDNAEYIMGVQSVALASQNILLRATEIKLGVLWLCAPLFCPEDIQDVLEIPSNIIPQAMLIVGIPDEDPIKPRRRALKDVIHYNGW